MLFPESTVYTTVRKALVSEKTVRGQTRVLNKQEAQTIREGGAASAVDGMHAVHFLHEVIGKICTGSCCACSYAGEQLFHRHCIGIHGAGGMPEMPLRVRNIQRPFSERGFPDLTARMIGQNPGDRHDCIIPKRGGIQCCTHVERRKELVLKKTADGLPCDFLKHTADDAKAEIAVGKGTGVSRTDIRGLQHFIQRTAGEEHTVHLWNVPECGGMGEQVTECDAPECRRIRTKKIRDRIIKCKGIFADQVQGQQGGRHLGQGRHAKERGCICCVHAVPDAGEYRGALLSAHQVQGSTVHMIAAEKLCICIQINGLPVGGMRELSPDRRGQERERSAVGQITKRRGRHGVPPWKNEDRKAQRQGAGQKRNTSD